jgi:hypothetical protein
MFMKELGHLDHRLTAASGQCSSKMDNAAWNPVPSALVILLTTKKQHLAHPLEPGVQLLRGRRMSDAILPRKSLLHDP